ncbi:MAG: MCE family protein [Planctomycetes bacterium]|nr:MCE family protein [Planctomycetota bacterium]
MTERGKNLAVGATVIVGLGFLAGMIVLFTGLPEMFQTGYTLRMEFTDTFDVQAGEPIYVVGMQVGRVTKVEFTDPENPAGGITFTARINGNVRLPGTSQPTMFSKGFAGKGYFAFKFDGPPVINPKTGQPYEFLPTDGSCPPLTGVHKGSGLIPDEVTQAVKGMAKLTDALGSMLAPASQPAASQAGSQPASTQPSQELPGGLPGVVARLTRTLDDIHAVAGDAQNQQNIRDSLANINRSSQRMGDLTDRLIADAENISVLLKTINKAAAKVEAGEGTVGKLLNDTKLYNNLLDATNQLNDLLKDLRVLVETWKKDGVKVKV